MNNELYHFGTPRHSGRYPWGSGDRPFQSSGGNKSYREKLEDKSLDRSKRVAEKAHREADMYVSKYQKKADKRAKSAADHPTSMIKLNRAYRAKREAEHAKKRAEDYTRPYDDEVKRKERVINENRQYREDRKRVKEARKQAREENGLQLTDTQKALIKRGASIAATLLSSYAGYKLSSSSKTRSLIYKGMTKASKTNYDDIWNNFEIEIVKK